MTSSDIILSVFKESLELRDLQKIDEGAIHRVVHLLSQSLKNGGKLLVFGNGGSAADAQHFSAELVGRFHKLERRGLAALALTTNSSITSALANDYDYSIVFSRQIEALGGPHDVALGISTSGNAKSVLLGFEAAIQKKMKTLFLTGKTGGKIYDALHRDLNEVVKIPSDNTGRIQEMHITYLHLFSALIEYELFGKT